MKTRKSIQRFNALYMRKCVCICHIKVKTWGSHLLDILLVLIIFEHVIVRVVIVLFLIVIVLLTFSLLVMMMVQLLLLLINVHHWPTAHDRLLGLRWRESLLRTRL